MHFIELPHLLLDLLVAVNGGLIDAVLLEQLRIHVASPIAKPSDAVLQLGDACPQRVVLTPGGYHPLLCLC